MSSLLLFSHICEQLVLVDRKNHPDAAVLNVSVNSALKHAVQGTSADGTTLPLSGEVDFICGGPPWSVFLHLLVSTFPTYS